MDRSRSARGNMLCDLVLVCVVLYCSRVRPLGKTGVSIFGLRGVV